MEKNYNLLGCTPKLEVFKEEELLSKYYHYDESRTRVYELLRSYGINAFPIYELVELSASDVSIAITFLHLAGLYKYSINEIQPDDSYIESVISQLSEGSIYDDISGRNGYIVDYDLENAIVYYISDRDYIKCYDKYVNSIGETEADFVPKDFLKVIKQNAKNIYEASIDNVYHNGRLGKALNKTLIK